MVRVHVGEPISTEHVRRVEEAVLKTVAPHKASGVQVLGAPPFSFRLIVQKKNGRLTSGRLGSITSSGDQLFKFLRSSKAEQPVDNRQTAARYRAEGPSRWMAESVNAAA